LIADQRSTRDGHGLHAKLARGSPRNTGQKGINSTLGQQGSPESETSTKDAGLALGWRWVGAGLALGWRWVGAGLALGWRWVGAGWALGWRWVGAGLACPLGASRHPNKHQTVKPLCANEAPQRPTQHASHVNRTLANSPPSRAPHKAARTPSPTKITLCSTWNIAERLRSPSPVHTQRHRRWRLNPSR
jgi:hypothetical protein